MKKLGGFLCIALAISFGIPGAGAAEKKSKTEIGSYRQEGIDVVQRRVFRKGLRHEFTVGGSVVPNNTFLMLGLVEFQYTFHFRETLAFQASYGRAFSSEKSIINDLASLPCPFPGLSDLDGDGTPDSACPVELQFPPDPLKNAYFGNIVWSPIYGKFSIFSKKIYHFDIFILAGAGLYDNARSNRFAFNIGVGGKIFLNEWFALRIDFRNITVREAAPFNRIVNNRMFSLGASFFLPPTLN